MATLFGLQITLAQPIRIDDVLIVLGELGRVEEITGSFYLWGDDAMPLAPLRQERERICLGAPEWGCRVCGLQVTDTNERAMQVRVLVCADDAGKVWDLRCRVREEGRTSSSRTIPVACRACGRRRTSLPVARASCRRSANSQAGSGKR